MKTFIVALLALVVGSALLLPEVADAKRFGGGKSMGQQYRQTPPRQAQSPRQQQAAPTANTATGAAAGTAAAQGARSGASRWLGPLAGLAAGGLLAAMLFGDGFSGFQFMDFLVIALLVFGGFMLFRMLRRRAAANGPAPVAVGAGGGYARTGADGPLNQPRAGGAFGGSTGAPAYAAPAAEAPAWFDGATFAAGAKAHFARLQAAWDANDLAEIETYTAPALFAELRAERASLPATGNSTEVVRLDAELLDVRRDGDQVVASVRFSGLIREDANAPAQPLDETWHVAHAWAAPHGDWLIVGIQQADA